VRLDAQRLAEARHIAEAMSEFRGAYRALEAEVARQPAEARARRRAEVQRFYRGGTAVPGDDAAIALQSLFIVDNPNPDALRARLDRPAGSGRYGEVHAERHPLLRSNLHWDGYEDLFLIDHETGRVVYTVAKKVDFGASLLSGPYRDTRLSRAFRAARASVDADFAQLVDFESYAPIRGAPAAFVAAPIFAEGRRLGVVALQVPLARIDAIMTTDQKWELRGLGRTGETYLVGADHRMRSDSRFLLESPEEFFESIEGKGVPSEALDLMRTHRSSVLFLPIGSIAVREALAGNTGTHVGPDYRERPAIVAYAPVSLPDLRWGIVAKLDTAEAFAPAAALRRALVVTGGLMAVFVIVAGGLLARSLTASIHRLIAGMRTLAQGDLSARVVATRGGEIGQIATAFNRMADDLQRTTVSRDHLNSILDSMSDALIVVRPPAEGADWRDAVMVTVNPAASAMLGRPAAELEGRPVGEVITAISAEDGTPSSASGMRLEEVLRQGRIGGREVVYRIRDGRDVPVLLSSAVMRQGQGGVGGIVWAAHDLTDLKAMEARGAFIRETFGRYVSDDVVATLLASPEALALGGELRRVTVLMSDLRGFTGVVERLSPQDAIAFLNGYLQTMVDLILHYRGTINEILGDGILVIFGAPTVAPDDAERAVACALAMQLAMDGVNARGREQGLPEVEMGIGVNTGEVIVGNIGSARRMKYAAVGTHVNLTGRIESYTTGGQILIAESTRKEVEALVSVGRQLQIEAKGASQPITAWEVTGLGGAHGLYLRPPPTQMTALATPIPVRYALLEGKHVGGEALPGQLVRLSEKGAELRPAAPLPLLSNLKMWIGDVPGDVAAGELYAKVVEESREAPAVILRFTSMTPEVRSALAGRA
jgi:PAS domain S-box-containing protein